MKRRFVKSLMGLVLAGTLMVGEVGTVFAAESAVVTTEASTEDLEDMEAEESTEVMESTETEEPETVVTPSETEEPTEASTETEEPAEVTVEDTEATGTAGTPAQVTGLAVSGSYLTWDSQNRTAYGYDVKATNAAGVTFYSWEGYTETKGYQYGVDSATSHYNTIRVNSRKITENLNNELEDSKYLVPGTGYSYQVRAVNRVSATDAEGNTTYTYTYGPWSKAVSFTLPAYAKYTNVSVEPELTNSDRLYLDLGKSREGFYSIFMDIYTDAACKQKVQKWPWRMYESYSGAGRLVYAYPSGLTAGQTYYARIYEADTSYSDDLQLAQAGITKSNVMAFVLPKEKPSFTEIPAMTALKVVKTDKEGIWLNTAFSANFDTYKGMNNISYEYSADGETWTTLTTQTNSKDILVSNTTLANKVRKPNTPVYIRAKANVKVNGSSKDTAYSPTLTVKSPTISTIKNLTCEQTSSGYIFRYTGTVGEFERVCFQYSTNKSFLDNYSSVTENKNVITTSSSLINYSSLEPGKTYYVRAYVYSSYYYDWDTIYGYQHSAYTNVITIKPTVPSASAYARVDATSVQISMGIKEDGLVTGYEVARKNGKSYKVLAKTTDSLYKDIKLKSDTKYTYRVRTYYFNTKTQKTSYGKPAYVSATTWGSALELVAVPASTTSVKLTWKKVSGAQGYEIYRTVGEGIITLRNNTSYESNGDFDKMQLIKKITKSSARSYTDKGLDTGAGYTYLVRAYREKGGKKYYISDTASANLGLVAPAIIKKTQSSKTGKMTVTWKRVIAANGYLIEKKDKETGEWTTVKNIKKNSTVKYTLPAVKGEDTFVEYRIRAYSGKQYSSATGLTVYRSVATVSGVKAKASSDGSITLSWKKVSGADYYQVYRTTSSKYYTDAVTGKIQKNGVLVYNYEKDLSYSSGYRSLSYVTTTKLVDKKVSYTNAYGDEVIINEGPASGVKYYYYVVAYKIVDEDYNAAEAAKDKTNLKNFTAVSSYGCAKPVSAKVSAAKPATPSVKSVKSSKKKQATVTLSKKVNGAVKYEIYRSTNSKKGFKLVGTTTKTTYTDKKVSSKKTYYYKVRAVKYNDAGIEVYSNYSKVSKSVKVK